MISLLESFTYWHWIALGCALLAAELIGAAGYLLWLGFSAIMLGILLAILPLPWAVQWLSFAFLSLLTTWVWWKKQSQKDRLDDEKSSLNQKHKQLIGTVIRLEEDVLVGTNRIKVADSTWSAKSDSSISAGTVVKITAMDGIELTIEAVEKTDEDNHL